MQYGKQSGEGTCRGHDKLARATERVLFHHISSVSLMDSIGVLLGIGRKGARDMVYSLQGCRIPGTYCFSLLFSCLNSLQLILLGSEMHGASSWRRRFMDGYLVARDEWNFGWSIFMYGSCSRWKEGGRVVAAGNAMA
ncbi:hypothetical protein QBC47DRAFT_66102 [Echria macrotheca]|uniref:Uncharacterized protein n=1 Tax=Echria macrotheca TaxID=438768 RepID=A0AAJ0F690_9PEZI|nr:hypothetical protein QBC47DRAFT_66102 [Echria macrotheca]